MNFDEVPAQPAHELPRLLVRRNKRRHHEDSVFFQSAGDKSHSPDVRDALGAREPGLGEDVANRVTVEILDLVASPFQVLSYRFTDRALSRAGQSSEPENGCIRCTPAESNPVPDTLEQPEQTDL